MAPTQMQQIDVEGRALRGWLTGRPAGRRLILGLLLAAVALVQIGLLLDDFAWVGLKRVWRHRSRPAVERSAMFVFGPDFADFVGFTRSVIPEEAAVLMPPRPSRDLMAYFLAPRRVVTCADLSLPPTAACTARALEKGLYVLAVGEFPPGGADLAGGWAAFQPEGEYRGVLVPPGGGVADHRPPGPLDYLKALATDVAWVSGLVLLGWLIATRLLGPGPEALAVAFPLGAGLVTWVLFLGSWAGVPLNATTVLLVLAGLLVTAVFAFRGALVSIAIESRLRPPALRRRAALWEVLPLAVLAALAGLALVLSLGYSYARWDPIAIWGVKGYGMAVEGSIFGAERWGEEGLAYVLNLPVLNATFYLLSRDLIPGSKVVPVLFFISLVGACLLFWRRARVPASLAGWAAVVLASVPLLFEHATAGYTNLPFATYLVLGSVLALEAFQDATPGRWALSGVLFGLAVWTRVEGLVFTGAAVLALSLAAGLARVRPPARWLVGWLGLGAPWLAFYLLHGTSASKSGEALANLWAGLGVGEANLWALRQTLAHWGAILLNPKRWGLAVPLAALLLGVSGVRLRRRGLRLLGGGLALAAASAALAALATFFVASYRHTPDSFETWLGIAFARVAFPVLVLVTLLGSLTLASPPAGEAWKQGSERG